ncbi:TPA: hypothetical protein ACG3P3_001483 [Clostridioides difficile]
MTKIIAAIIEPKTILTKFSIPIIYKKYIKIMSRITKTINSFLSISSLKVFLSSFILKLNAVSNAIYFPRNSAIIRDVNSFGT